MKYLFLLVSFWMGSISLAQNTVSSATLPTGIAASSRQEALVTDSIYYSLPREDMSYFEIGALSQRQAFKSDAMPAGVAVEEDRLNNQAFYFRHSRGITENFALDFNLNYFLRDEDARYGTDGVNELTIGSRSAFEAANMSWIYGMALTYLPNGEYNDETSKLAATARIGFEEAVDIARWGLEAEVSTEDAIHTNDQVNLIGFFEIPFVQRFHTGVAAGTDIRRLSVDEQTNFAQVYGQFYMDPVSAAQLSLRQNNSKQNEESVRETDVSLALTRVF